MPPAQCNDLTGVHALGAFAERARPRPAYEEGAPAPASWRHSPLRRRDNDSPAQARVGPLCQPTLLRFLSPKPPAARAGASPAAPADAPADAAERDDADAGARPASPPADPEPADEAADDADGEPPPWHAWGGAHALQLSELLGAALAREGALLSEGERDWIARYLALPASARALYARLFARAPSAFRLRSLRYAEVGDVDAAAAALAAAGLVLVVRDVLAEADPAALALLLAAATVGELRALASGVGVRGAGARRNDLVGALAVRLGAREAAPASASAAPRVLGRLAAPRACLRAVGLLLCPCVLLRAPPVQAFERCARLLQGLGAPKGGLALAAAAEMGAVRFAEYRTWTAVAAARCRDAAGDGGGGGDADGGGGGADAAGALGGCTFTSRAALERHERDCELCAAYETALAASDWAACDALAADASRALGALARRCAAAAAEDGAPSGGAQRAWLLATAACALPADASADAAAASLEPSEAEGWAARARARPAAARLSGGCALCALLTVHAAALARRREPARAAETCALLLLGPFGGSRRGHWWARLLIDGAKARALTAQTHAADDAAHTADDADDAERVGSGASAAEALACAALADSAVRTGERHGLLERARRLYAARARAGAAAPAAPAAADADAAAGCGPAWRALVGAVLRGYGAQPLPPLPPPAPEPPTLTLRARALDGDGHGGVGGRGGRVRYAGARGAGLACTVEELVLQLHGAGCDGEADETLSASSPTPPPTQAGPETAADGAADAPARARGGGWSGWRGVHCESGACTALFALLLWDALFDEAVPAALLSRAQSAPLDLCSDAFLDARRGALERRLTDLAAMRAEALAAEVDAAIEAKRGIVCVGLRWARWTRRAAAADGVAEEAAPGEAVAPGATAAAARVGDGGAASYELSEMAACLGGRALAAILTLLCEDYAGWARGMPDLLLWARRTPTTAAAAALPAEPSPAATSAASAAAPAEPGHAPSDRAASASAPAPRAASAVYGVAKFVEVKSERDRLSDQQRAWLRALAQAGVRAEVVRVLPPGALGTAESDPIPSPAELAAALGRPREACDGGGDARAAPRAGDDDGGGGADAAARAAQRPRLQAPAGAHAARNAPARRAVAHPAAVDAPVERPPKARDDAARAPARKRSRAVGGGGGGPPREEAAVARATRPHAVIHLVDSDDDFQQRPPSSHNKPPAVRTAAR
jgi:hypothetical protein